MSLGKTEDVHPLKGFFSISFRFCFVLSLLVAVAVAVAVAVCTSMEKNYFFLNFREWERQVYATLLIHVIPSNQVGPKLNSYSNTHVMLCLSLTATPGCIQA